MIRRMGERCTVWARRWMPDPFLFAVLLTLLTLALGVLLGGATPWEMVRHWGAGFWDLLSFAMEMCLILMTGHALAHAPPVRRLVDRLAEVPRTASSAAALVALVACTASLINWGLGLVVGALMALEVGRRAADRGVAVHYPLLGAAGYSGMVIWHGGLSGSAPVKVATPGHFLEAEMGVLPLGETLLSPLNLATCLVLLAAVPWLCARMAPRDPARMQPVPERMRPRPGDAGTRRENGAARREGAGARRTPAAVLNDSATLSLLTGGLGLLYVGDRLLVSGFRLDLATINLLFLSVGIVLHGRPIRYVRAMEEAVRAASGIILQFPFYAGIASMLRGSGLAPLLAGGFPAISTPATFPVLCFLSAGLLNLFIPSGGGQWAVQGPILLEAAREIGVPARRVVMALAYGDQWTNMLQPFWALALLGITGLRAREVMGYTSVLWIFTGAIFALTLLLLPA